jgi:hypothetical protein
LVYEAAEGSPNRGFKIFIGDQVYAESEAMLEAGGIKYILNCTEDAPNAFEADAYEYARLAVGETTAELPQVDFERALDFMRRASEELRPLLVHCSSGNSLSALMVAVFLVFEGEEPSLDEALEFLRSKRMTIAPSAKHLAWGRAFVEYFEGMEEPEADA